MKAACNVRAGLACEAGGFQGGVTVGGLGNVELARKFSMESRRVSLEGYKDARYNVPIFLFQNICHGSRFFSINNIYIKIILRLE